MPGTAPGHDKQMLLVAQLTGAVGFRAGQNAESFQIDQHGAFEDLLRAHRHFPRLEIALREQRGDAVGDRPDMQAHELEGWPLGLGQRTTQRRGGTLENVEGALGGRQRLTLGAGGGHPRFEHHRVACRLLAREGKIGLAEIIERGERRVHSVVPRLVETRGEALEAALGDLGEKGVAVGEMAVRRRGAHARQARGLGEAEASRSVLLDQLAGGLEQHLFEGAVVIGAGAAPAARIGGGHVKGYYMKSGRATRRRRPGACLRLLSYHAIRDGTCMVFYARPDNLPAAGGQWSPTQKQGGWRSKHHADDRERERANEPSHHNPLSTKSEPGYCRGCASAAGGLVSRMTGKS